MVDRLERGRGQIAFEARAADGIPFKMRELLIWSLAVESVGVAATPLTFAALSGLPDRGYAFSKVVGLLFLGYGLWLGASLGLLPYGRGAVFLVLLLMALLSAFVAMRQRRQLARFLRSGWRYIAFVEALFLVALAGAVFLRSFAPDLVWGEKPMEMAFLNAIQRSESFPPHDPWLAGHSLNYYYFGYVIVSALTKLTALSTSVTFFLSLSLVFALAAVGAFGLVYNMIAAGGRADERPDGPALVPRAAVFGLAAAGLMLVVSNLAGVFELLARHGVGSTGFYDLVGIAGLDSAYDCSAVPEDCAEWYPTRFWWWWKATRMGSSADIQEFPLFSFQFGDLHPHVLVMPFVLTALAVALHTVLRAEKLNALSALRHPWSVLFAATLLGAIAVTEAWALPVSVAAVLLAVAIANWLRSGERPLRAAIDSAGFAATVIAALAVIFLPFYLEYDAPTYGIGITRVSTTEFWPRQSQVTRPLHFALFWGPLLWIVASSIGAYLFTQRREASRRRLLGVAALAWAVPVGLWAALVLGDGGPSGLADELEARGGNLITVGGIAVTLTAAALAFFHRLHHSAQESDRGQLFALFLGALGLLMLLGVEFYYVKDPSGWRVNTVFRWWHETWMVLSIAAAFGLYALTRDWRLPNVRWREGRWRLMAALGIAFGAAYTALVAVDPWEVLYSRWWTATLGLLVAAACIVGYAAAAALRGAPALTAWPRLGWLAVTAVILGAALVYPVAVTFERTGGFRNPHGIDGLAYLRRDEPDEYAAIQWLGSHVEGAPVVLEAAGDRRSGGGRISSRTGLPAVIGWLGHELRWRGYPFDGRAPASSIESPFSGRPEDVAAVYQTADVEDAKGLLERYGVKYVYVGWLERHKYGEAGLAKFRRFLVTVFRSETVTIYEVPPEGAVDAAR